MSLPAPLPQEPGLASATAAGHRAASAWVALALVWALLLGGWLTLGALSLRHAPAQAGALAAVALWLLTLGVASAGSASWAIPPLALRAVLVVSAATTALSLVALTQALPGALWLTAIAWAVLLAGAVRVAGSAGASAGRPSAVLPASIGAGGAWALAGDPLAWLGQPGLAGAAILAVGLGLAWLVPAATDRPSRPPGGLGGGLGCAVAWPALARWRDPANWPWLAASLAMLPMMASLPLMVESCAGAGWSAHAITAAHLLAMLAPAWIVAAAGSAPLLRSLPALVTLALVAGAVVALVAPGPTGLMAAMVLQSVAWGLAWAAANRPLALARAPGPCPWAPSCASALAGATAVLLLGLLVGAGGWSVWSGAAAGLGGLAAAGLLASGLRRQPLSLELKA